MTVHIDSPPYDVDRRDAASPAAAAGQAVSPTTAEFAAQTGLEERSLPTQVSAAWELELLIAGAVTFALVQLPAQVDAVRDAFASRIGSRESEIAVILGVAYLKAALYSLIFGFVVNLSARAYWVGLVGLHSVYPRGVQWDRLGMGPVATALYRRRIASLPSVIARVDNFASIVFSFTFLIAMTVGLSVLGLGVAGAIAWVLARLLFGGEHLALIVYLLGALLVVPGTVASVVDKRIGGRLHPGDTTWRRLERMLGSLTWFNGSTLLGPHVLSVGQPPRVPRSPRGPASAVPAQAIPFYR